MLFNFYEIVVVLNRVRSRLSIHHVVDRIHTQIEINIGTIGETVASHHLSPR